MTDENFTTSPSPLRDTVERIVGHATMARDGIPSDPLAAGDHFVELALRCYAAAGLDAMATFDRLMEILP